MPSLSRNLRVPRIAIVGRVGDGANAYGGFCQSSISMPKVRCFGIKLKARVQKIPGRWLPTFLPESAPKKPLAATLSASVYSDVSFARGGLAPAAGRPFSAKTNRRRFRRRCELETWNPTEVYFCQSDDRCPGKQHRTHGPRASAGEGGGTSVQKSGAACRAAGELTWFRA